MDQDNNPIKSIIYGNQVRNPYGNFRSFCAALASMEQIQIVINHLKTNEKFHKYNRYSYAYRVYEFQSVFLTQDQLNSEVQQNRILQGYQEDETLEGTGEKLLHLLQKFNVENVLIVSAIEQYNPLYRFEPSHYRIIVERSKELLNNLYQKVVQQEEDEKRQPQEIEANVKILAKLPKTQFEVPLVSKPAKFAKLEDRQNNRPGHFYSENPPFKVSKKPKQNPLPPISEKKKLQDLNQRLKNTAYQLEKILESLAEKEYLQLRFIVKYDQNKLIEKVLDLFMMLFNVQSREQLANDFDFQSKMETVTVNDLDDKKVRKINETLRGDRRLNVYQLANVNPLISIIFSFMVLLVKSYEIGKDMLKLTQNLAEEDFEYQMEDN